MDYDAQYARLRNSGQPGWGAATYHHRLEGWVKTVARLCAGGPFPPPPCRVLELGSGNGMVSSLFARRGYSVEGVEISNAAVAWATQLFAQAGLKGTFRQGDVCKMPFHADGAFDAAIDGNCLHCLIGRARSRCLSEVKRVLRNRGVFVVSSMCGEPKSADALARFDRSSRLLFRNGQPYRLLADADEIANEVATAGFEVVWQEVNEGRNWDHVTLSAVTQPS